MLNRNDFKVALALINFYRAPVPPPPGVRIQNSVRMPSPVRGPIPVSQWGPVRNHAPRGPASAIRTSSVRGPTPQRMLSTIPTNPRLLLTSYSSTSGISRTSSGTVTSSLASSPRVIQYAAKSTKALNQSSSEGLLIHKIKHLELSFSKHLCLQGVIRKPRVSSKITYWGDQLACLAVWYNKLYLLTRVPVRYKVVKVYRADRAARTSSLSFLYRPVRRGRTLLTIFHYPQQGRKKKYFWLVLLDSKEFWSVY